MKKNHFEKLAWGKNKYVCGIDEVGRGCLAGPLVTCCLILPQNSDHKLLKDSKVLSEKNRNEAFAWIKKNCVYSIAIADNLLIDTINIYQATLFAMKKSLIQLLCTTPFSVQKIDSVLIDAVPLKIPENLCPQNLKFHSFPKGESYSTSIAAASIVAKVFRDGLLKKIDPVFPEFDLKRNKGYGTSRHLEALDSQGTTLIHRHSFTPKKQINQKSIF